MAVKIDNIHPSVKTIRKPLNQCNMDNKYSKYVFSKNTLNILKQIKNTLSIIDW